MHAAPRPWGEAESSTLAKLWAEGLSASQIAKQLGTGRTRNATIGRVHRMGLAGRATPSRPAKRPVRTCTRAIPQPPRLPRVIATALAGEKAAIAALAPIDAQLGVLGLTNFTCRYPIGDPQDSDFTFCGRTCNNIENPYCVQHAKLCYVKPNKRRSQATERLANWLDRRNRKGGFAA